MSVPLIDLGRQHNPIKRELMQAFEKVLESNQFILGEEVKKFILYPALISRMGNESRKIAVAKFDVKNVVQEMLKFYPSLTDKGSIHTPHR